MSPASESKMKVAGLSAFELVDGSWKPSVGLNTSPVGAPPSTGTTSSGPWIGLPSTAPAYTVLESVWLFATQIGGVGPAARAHPFWRLGSLRGATPAWSLTRLVRE